MKEYKVKAIPFDHEDINRWRDNFTGMQHLHKATNFLLTGAIDDVWVNPEGEFIIVDYKSTAKEGEVNLDAEWQDGYKRQMEFYQWLFRQEGFKVSPTGYFVYANGDTDKDAFDGKLEFDVKIIAYTGDDSWIEGKLAEIKKALDSDKIPDADQDCDYCLYREAVSENA